MIDIKNYNELKAKSLISIVNTGADPNDASVATYAVSVQQYSLEDGSRLPDVVTGVTLTELNAQLAEAEAKIKELKAFIADCKLAKKG